tara:strand:- start:156 stop:314 length:159 start_codon:yes stop_codon:yes gene_type:complete
MIDIGKAKWNRGRHSKIYEGLHSYAITKNAAETTREGGDELWFIQSRYCLNS